MVTAERIAITFTGQGAQWVGMWNSFRESPAARAIFRMTDEIVGGERPLSEICAEGPREELTATQNAQPAIIAWELAALAVARENGLPPADYVLGHSAAEYTALAAAEVFDNSTAISLVRHRGLTMQEHGGAGTMAALFTDEVRVRDICARAKNGGIGVEAVNLNSPGQTVVSGIKGEVEETIELAEEEEVPARRLVVSHPFHHSVLMRKVGEKYGKELAGVPFGRAKMPVVLNVTAEPMQDGAEIRRILVRQVDSPVRWYQSVQYILNQGVTTFIEIGPRPVLTGFLKEISAEARGFCISDYESAKNFRQYL